jgi:folylpolyglutamate synthase/dihydropteroate synthase
MSIAKDLNIKFYCKNSLKEALYSKLTLPNSKILIFGSLYLAGEALSLDKI